MKQKLSKMFRRWLGRLFDEKKPEDLSEVEVMKILRKMNVSNPKNREQDCVDRQFLRLLPILHKHNLSLNFLNVYGYVCDTYFEHLKAADRTLELQYRLCEVWYHDYTGRYFAKYSNLLSGYLKRWDFASEVIAEIFSDEKYQDVVRIYKMFRK